jgi:hypothetical protein
MFTRYGIKRTSRGITMAFPPMPFEPMPYRDVLPLIAYGLVLAKPHPYRFWEVCIAPNWWGVHARPDIVDANGAPSLALSTIVAPGSPFTAVRCMNLAFKLYEYANADIIDIEPYIKEAEEKLMSY